MKKTNNFLFTVLMLLPFITFIVYSFINFHSSEGMTSSTLLSEFNNIFSYFSFPFVSDPLKTLLTKFGTFPFLSSFCSYISYCVIVVLGWLVYQFTVFIPLMCQKWIGGLYDKTK